jgi:HD-like signal output (HDOD) protein
MTDYLRHLAEHRRLSILKVLDRAPGYSANDSVLHDAVVSLGISSTRDQVRGDLGWLAEQQLVTLRDVEMLKVATITVRGADVAKGLAIVEGVKRPSASF